ncbi:unnamed protein product [Schistocephalus solidus]|uniref:Uncharacterized protein n=1 Tax=Schistocephalus solidus TaxID=70667 RepID=A0A183T9N9_SCHSO|nr:unnamed protein product [Schistocephalus solidus]
MFCVEYLNGELRVGLQWIVPNVAFMALPLRGIRARCGGTPRGGSGRASHTGPLPSPVFLTLSLHWVQVGEEERVRIVGYDKEKCSQPASVGLALRYLCGPGPVVFFVLALICLYFYPLSNARLSELRSKIMLRSNASTCNMLRSSVVNSEVDVNDPSLVLSPWSSARI